MFNSQSAQRGATLQPTSRSEQPKKTTRSTDTPLAMESTLKAQNDEKQVSLLIELKERDQELSRLTQEKYQIELDNQRTLEDNFALNKKLEEQSKIIRELKEQNKLKD